MVVNNKENRSKLADKIFENLDEGSIRLLAYKGLLNIYFHSPYVFQHDWVQEFPKVPDVIDLSL